MANIIKTTLEDANDVLTYSNKASFPSSGESGKLYIAADTKYTYFWNGSSYIETRGSGYASSGHTHEERFILEHNKSEAERSANLFNVNNVEYGSINEDGTNLENGTARARSFYIPILANTYYSISTNNSELLIYELYQYDSNKSHIEPYTSILNNTFTFLTRNNTYYIRILFRNTSNTDFNLDILSRVMLNYGTTPLPYQPYEGKVVHEKGLGDYVPEKNMLKDNTNLNTVITSGFYRLQAISPYINGMDVSYGQMIVCQGGADTIAQLVLPYRSSKMLFRTGYPVNNPGGKWNDWKEVSLEGHTHTSINTAFVFNNNDMPEGSANLASTTTAHKLTLYRNGLSIPYQMDDSNDGGILRCRGTSESNTILELATWDDYGTGETIQFNYYPTNSQATPTHSITVPKKTGTIALTSDIPETASSSTLGLVKSSTTGTAANRDYKVQVNDDGTMKVNVPWTDNNTTYSAGTGLSLSGTTFSVKTGYTTNANNRNYKVAADSNGNLYVNVPWSSSGTLDTSLNSSSTNALQNKAVYSAFSSAVGYDNNYYTYGATGSWRMRQYNNTGNSLDIKYGVIAVNSQSANYSVSFGNGKKFTSTNYTVVFGLYRSNAQSWFWSPIVQSKTESGFTVFLRGNSSGDNSGTIMYLAIRSN